MCTGLGGLGASGLAPLPCPVHTKVGHKTNTTLKVGMGSAKDLFNWGKDLSKIYVDSKNTYVKLFINRHKLYTFRNLKS